MQTTELFRDLPIQAVGDAFTVSITDLTDDSRAVTSGSLFIAVDGTKVTGLDYAEKAIQNGAAAILADARHLARLQALAGQHGISIYAADDFRQTVGILAVRFFQPQPQHVVAVTGTDGKSSTVHFTRQLWEQAGLAAASLGTVGVEGKAVPDALKIDLGNTTPGTLALHRCLQQLGQAELTHVAMEASSHGLDQQRLAGIRLSSAAFTNLTRDHLDYHGTLEAYFEAKAKLFSEVLPDHGSAIINHDDSHAETLIAIARRRGQRLVTYGRHPEADLRITATTALPHGQRWNMRLFGQPASVEVGLLGDFQLQNVLAAAGMALATGVKPEQLATFLPQLTSVPGRMEWIGQTAKGATALVDYAHTPAALDNLLRAIRPHCRGKLWVVFGCGGDRDKGKRPEMGTVAGQRADIALVTDDNPRTEEAATIRAEILGGMTGATAKVQEIGGRREAIAYALREAGEGDMVVMAGKGHETTQTIGTVHHPFHERNIVRELLNQEAAA